jgi:hypothetical protein
MRTALIQLSRADFFIGAMKLANKPGRPGAESLEPRKTEGNPGNGKNTGTSRGW